MLKMCQNNKDILKKLGDNRPTCLLNNRYICDFRGNNNAFYHIKKNDESFHFKNTLKVIVPYIFFFIIPKKKTVGLC